MNTIQACRAEVKRLQIAYETHQEALYRLKIETDNIGYALTVAKVRLRNATDPHTPQQPDHLMQQTGQSRHVRPM